MLQVGQDPDEVYIAETANQERNEEEYNAELQSHRQEDFQLSICEVLITHLDVLVDTWDTVVWGGIWRVFSTNKGYYEHNAQVEKGENPEEDAGSDSIHWPSFQGVLDGESHTQVALDTDSSEEESAVVDSHVEDEAWQWAQYIGHVPEHVVHHFLHLERQEQQKKQVRDGQVEEQDVNGCGSLPHFLPKSVEGEDIGWEAQHKGKDINGQTQRCVALLHGGFGVSQSVT